MCGAAFFLQTPGGKAGRRPGSRFAAQPCRVRLALLMQVYYNNGKRPAARVWEAVCLNLNKDAMKKIALLIAGGVVLYWGLEHIDALWQALRWLAGLAFPLILGFCMAFVLNVPMRFLERHLWRATKNRRLAALRRPVCIAASLLFICAVVALVFALVIPELVNAFAVLGTAIPQFINGLIDWARQNADQWPMIQQYLEDLSIDWNALGRTVLDFVTTGAGSLLGSTVQAVSSTVSGVTNGVIGFILALYILLSKETLKRQLKALCKAFLPEKAGDSVLFVARLASRTFASYVTGQCLEACILGSLCWLGMLVLQLPYAPMVGALISLTALIPIVGAFVGLLVGAFMIAMVSPVKALIFVVFLLVLQQIEGNLIYPRVVGSSVGLPAIWVLTAVTVGGGLLGVGGMLFAVPTVSVVYALARLATQKRLEAKGIPYEEV